MRDTAYENHVVIHSSENMVVKSFKHQKNFLVEQECYRLIASSGIAPKLIKAENNSLSIEYIDGECLEKEDFRENDVIHCAADTIYKLHHITTFDRVGSLLSLEKETWKEHLLRKTSLRIEQAKDSLLPLDRLLTEIQGIAEPDTLTLLHHDLKPSNMIKYGNKIYLIDFEKSSVGDFLYDLAKMKWRCFEGHQEGWNEFLDKYLQLTQKQYDTDELTHSINLYEMLHCLGALAYWHSYQIPDYKKHAISAENKLSNYLAK